MVYRPNLAVITNIDYDHPDYYKNLESVKQAFTKFVNNLKNNIKKTVVKDLGIKKGSLEDKLIQRYGEKNITLEELKKTTNKWEQVVKSSEFFRQTYDDLLKYCGLDTEAMVWIVEELKIIIK